MAYGVILRSRSLNPYVRFRIRALVLNTMMFVLHMLADSSNSVHHICTVVCALFRLMSNLIELTFSELNTELISKLDS